MILQEEKGQITVFLALIFLVLLGMSFCAIEGVRGYLETALAEDAVINAGEDVLANYDQPLFQRYHVYFLDPREKQYIISDGKEYLEHYFDESSFYGFSCQSLAVTEEKTAVDEDGVYLKHQIREWMKYRSVKSAGENLKQLFQASDEMSRESSQVNQEIEESAGEEKSATSESGKQPNSQNMEGQGEGTSQSPGMETNQEKNENVVDTTEKINWKNFKDTLDMILRSGILLYVIDDNKTVSNLTIPSGAIEQLPSKEWAKGEQKEWKMDEGENLSFWDLCRKKDVFSVEAFSSKNSHFLSDEYYMLGYVFSSYNHFLHPNIQKGTALRYEVEYLIGGKTSDLGNLKCVANRILLLRFLMNYSCASKDLQIKGKATALSAALTGFLGLPEAQKAVECLLIAALSYGESLLEVHALFSGKKIPAVKSAASWNLSFETAAIQLKEKVSVKKGDRNVGYEEYLKLLLALQSLSDSFLYRMMDMMQLNVGLEETGFLMKDCIFAFTWKVDFECFRWFQILSGPGLSGSNSFSIQLIRKNGY